MIRHGGKPQEAPNEGMKPQVDTKPPFERKIVWKNALGFLFLHLLGVYGLYLIVSAQIHWKTFVWMFAVGYASLGSITIGAHRLYSHRTFTASNSMKILLLVWQTIAGQNCTYIWVRDHRQHHKFSDTDADPHNATRGFFFSHMGWLMVRKHPDVIAKGKTIDMSDLEADPFVMFQKKYYKSLYFFLAFLLPIIVPCLMWDETLWNSYIVCYFLRVTLSLNATWTVNSAAHIWGNKPYNQNILPRENRFVAYLTNGEGYHNYHHQFPWDYRAAEFGMNFNLSTHYINFFANLGMATNLRSASDELVRRTIEKHGDGSHHLWGFGDSDMNPELHKVLAGNEDSANEKTSSIACQLVN